MSARTLFFSLLLLFTFTLPACTKLADQNSPWSLSAEETPSVAGPIPTAAPLETTPIIQTRPETTPTPDTPHNIPGLRKEPEQYTVQAGDTLHIIASRYGVSIEQIVEANTLANPDYLEIGQVLQIPAPPPGATGPALKLIPDSELVYGPNAANFDIASFILAKSGHLATYLEEVNGEFMTGAQIVERVAQNYSVNPRLLLAILEYQSQWVTNSAPKDDTLDFPMGLYDGYREGLYRQLAYTADNLNRGYYLWRVDGLGGFILLDNHLIPAAPTLNAGTIGVQYLFSRLYAETDWREAVSDQGFYQTYTRLFGSPFQFAYEPLIPPVLTQPTLQLPIESGEVWHFTGGPHGGWDEGSAWAALDFAPPGDAMGCVQSDEWVVAVADGYIARTGTGTVVLDLDGDGLEQTGWVIFYLHIESRDRIRQGTQVKAGDRLGHPSCEGGVSNGTHVHIARKYNGEWISADQPNLPFVMDGWVSQGTGNEYDGYLVRDGVMIEAYVGEEEGIGEIQR
ncbi:MAG: LysM peptidoglycan-binding domain-containing protein [Anaerolineales bacterium]|nr:LysM peptidoglycan-binding domain-containing protein [Anaerolineales bacterium]